MSVLLANVPEEAVSIVRRSKYLHMLGAEADLVSSFLHPIGVDSQFYDPIDAVYDDGIDSFSSCQDFPADDGDAHAARLGLPTKVVIRGMAGIGKSILAALLTCRQDIRQAFDFICWVNIGKRLHDTNPSAADVGTPALEGKERGNSLNYEMYRDCLRAMCRDLEVDADHRGIRQKFVEEVVCCAGDTPMQADAAQLRAMLAARSEMAQTLAGTVGNLLIVLDDVWCYEDVDLFNFCSCGPDGEDAGPERLSVLVTSRTVDEAQLPRTFMFSLGLLSKQNSVKLIGWELGLEEHFDFGALDKIYQLLFLEIAKKCDYLPLTIGILGRSIRTAANSEPKYTLEYIIKQAMIDWDQKDLERKYSAKNSPESASLYFTLDRPFSLVLSKAKSTGFLKLCFGALAVAFTRADCQRPWTCLKIVLLLWESLLESQDKDVLKTLREDGVFRSEDVCKILETLGVVNIIHDHEKEMKYIRVHHDLLWELGKQYLEINLMMKPTTKKERYFSLSWLKAARPADNILDTSATVSQCINQHVVNVCEEILKELYNSRTDSSYIFVFFPMHIIKSNNLSKAFNLLSKNKKFISTRLQEMGIEEGVQRHMQDIKLFYERSLYEENMTGSHTKNKWDIMELVNSIVFAIVSLNLLDVHSENSDPLALASIQRKNGLKARGLVIVGSVIQQFHLWNISMDCFSKAMQYLLFAEFPITHPDMKRVIRYIRTATLFQIQLVPRESPQRIVLKHANLLRDAASSAPLVLSSHPGQAIVPMKNNFEEANLFEPYCFLGLGAEESAMNATFDGDFITRIDDGAVMNVVGGSLYEGTELSIEKNGPKNKRERQKQLTKTNGSRRFIINGDGTVSACNRPHLVLGTSYYPRLYLVDRYSPNSAVFKNIETLYRSGKSPGFDNSSGIPLELLSHEGFGIGATSPFIPTRLKLGHIKVGLCSERNALKAVYCENKVILSSLNNICLSLYHPMPFAGNPIIAIGSEESNILHSIFEKFLLMVWSKPTYFSINRDGTMSPLNAPHLALGFQVPNFSNLRRDPILGRTHDPLENNTPSVAKRLQLSLICDFFVKFVINEK